MNKFLHIGARYKMNVLFVLTGLLVSSADVVGSTGLISSEASDLP